MQTVVWMLAAAWACAAHAGTVEGLSYRRVVHAEPRPLHIHVLTLDGQAPDLVLGLEVADPSDEGRGAVVLTNPYALGRRGEFLAAINANPWRMADDSVHYLDRRPAHILGWVHRDGVAIRPPGRYANFWMDEEGVAHIGYVSEPAEGAVIGVEGFHGLVEDGRVVAPDGGGQHPRTALGIDEAGRHVVMVVIDGRMRGFSEGVTLGELAQIMLELGCHDAINLDGGGSSVMLMRSGDGLRRMNMGVYGYLRPLPMMLGVRSRVR